MDAKLEGQVALITGAARGIGREVAARLARDGAAVVCADCLDPEETAAWIRSELGCQASSVTCDVTDHEGARSVVEGIQQSHGRVDILVNNAGITRDQLLVRMKPEDWNAVLQVNLTGAYNVTQAVARLMMKQRSGRVVNIASVVGLMGNAGQCNYSASKAGLVGMTKSLARELGSRNVTVNAVAPGYIQTAMTDVLDERQREALVSNLAIRRLGTPEDIAGAVAFLVGPDASYVTGTVLNVSGGLYM